MSEKCVYVLWSYNVVSTSKELLLHCRCFPWCVLHKNLGLLVTFEVDVVDVEGIHNWLDGIEMGRNTMEESCVYNQNQGKY